nr:biliary glycoprotein - human [Homo sapiens]
WGTSQPHFTECVYPGRGFCSQ